MPPRPRPDQSDAYRKCLRALLMAGSEHECPAGQAILAKTYETVCTLLVAEDPAAIHAVESEPLRILPRSNPNRSNCGTRRAF